ncbi:SDR family oxidoreductase [Tritonibacter horizontis]|uniref:Gluconate 5-dehydrogenase n=1 Tax=Tritonibacter horizontis TaxID=1768241 RepID=A0A132C1E1_9RHOB|nr:SDR family oxidoreductase [Tritonibacter horizontis]KUP94424.1 gluconate 5-dehydrogenase [Tritonibacter horizontis]
MSDIKGTTVLITGASRGIGAAAARSFAAAGANVVLAARSAAAISAIAEDITQSGGKARAIPCDVADWAQVQALVAETERQFGPVDLLINNAGLIDPIARLADSDVSGWTTVMDVNVKGVYHGLRAVLPTMEQRGAGTIINISSGAATGALEGWSHYCASKAAVLSLTRCAHVEYAPHGIRVMGLSPGTVATEMQERIRASGINPVSQLDPAVHIPADWVAQALLWLAGPGGDAWVGQDFALKSDEARRLLGLPPVTG